MKNEKSVGFVVLGFLVFVGVLGGALSPDEDAEEAIKVKEIVVEREVKRDVLSLTAVYKVCHGGRRHWAIEYGTGEKKSWFIAALPDNEKCDGEEKVHPSHRDKVLKEMKEREGQS